MDNHASLDIVEEEEDDLSSELGIQKVHTYMSVLKPNFPKKQTFEIRFSWQICNSINPKEVLKNLTDLLSRSIGVLERQIWQFLLQ